MKFTCRRLLRHVSQLSHDNAMKRVIQAGAKPVTALSVMLEWQRDWALKDTSSNHGHRENAFGAYGVGVEYAYTMVHGAPATKFPEYVVPAAEPRTSNRRTTLRQSTLIEPRGARLADKASRRDV